ncbi:MAG: TIGR02757 family protein [Ignavibacteria bacterium]|nr:TIGR02757 family protein [Ignavibacteria bacterium]
MKNEKIKKLLDFLYDKYNKVHSDDDPIWLLHSLKSQEDVEILGFIVSCYCYGRVEQIISLINRFKKSISRDVFNFVVNFDKKKDFKYCLGFNYRFNSEHDFIELISVLQKAIKSFGNLKSLFLKGYNSNEKTILQALNKFSKVLNSFSNRNNSFRYLIPIPENNSTCKRLNLFLRWMVREDNVDLGIWKNEIPKSKLIIPVDTHVYRQSINLKLISRKSCDIKFALELTERLKEFDPEDPVKYDFSLCHLDIKRK